MWDAKKLEIFFFRSITIYDQKSHLFSSSRTCFLQSFIFLLFIYFLFHQSIFICSCFWFVLEGGDSTRTSNPTPNPAVSFHNTRILDNVWVRKLDIGWGIECQQECEEHWWCSSRLSKFSCRIGRIRGSSRGGHGVAHLGVHVVVLELVEFGFLAELEIKSNRNKLIMSYICHYIRPSCHHWMEILGVSWSRTLNSDIPFANTYIDQPGANAQLTELSRPTILSLQEGARWFNSTSDPGIKNSTICWWFEANPQSLMIWSESRLHILEWIQTPQSSLIWSESVGLFLSELVVYFLKIKEKDFSQKLANRSQSNF